MRKRSRTISVPRSGETGREDGRAMHRNRGRARTMNVQRHVAAVWGEPSRHRTLPCQCEKCAADRASQHPMGEINEWGDNLVQPENKRQRERYDMTEGEEEEEPGQRERYGMTEW